MPFTPAHIAAVLPVRRARLLVPAALVIGSIVPDAPYFLPLDVPREVMHSWLGAFSWTALGGFVLWAIWEAVLAPPARDLAPDVVRRRLAPPSQRPAARLTKGRHLVAVYLSLVLGTLTHLVWDGLTHIGGWGPTLMPHLRRPLGSLLVVHWLHLASSVAGLAVVAVWVAWWLTRPDRGASPAAGRIVARRGARTAGALLVGLPLVGGLVELARIWHADLITKAYFVSIYAGSVAVGTACVVAAWWWVLEAANRSGPVAARIGAPVGEPDVDVMQGASAQPLGRTTGS
jgi:hypothetical protein